MQSLCSTMDVMHHCPNHQNKWLFDICESNSTSFWLLVWTHPPWIAITNICAIHDMMGVCNRFEIWRLLSQLLWTLDIAQHWRGCCFIKESCHFSSKSYFLVEFIPSSNQTCWKVKMLLSFNSLGPSMLFIEGWKFESHPFETSKQIILPPKDLAFQWPCLLFTHPGYGLVLPCHLVVEGQVHLALGK
jgi:hypothetical protein